MWPDASSAAQDKRRARDVCGESGRDRKSSWKKGSTEMFAVGDKRLFCRLGILKKWSASHWKRIFKYVFSSLSISFPELKFQIIDSFAWSFYLKVCAKDDVTKGSDTLPRLATALLARCLFRFLINARLHY